MVGDNFRLCCCCPCCCHTLDKGFFRSLAPHICLTSIPGKLMTMRNLEGDYHQRRWTEETKHGGQCSLSSCCLRGQSNCPTHGHTSRPKIDAAIPSQPCIRTCPTIHAAMPSQPSIGSGYEQREVGKRVAGGGGL
jgi:hypothetical protein